MTVDRLGTVYYGLVKGQTIKNSGTYAHHTK